MEKRFCPYCMCAVEAGEPCPNCGLTAGAYNPLPHHLPPGTVLMDRYLVGRVLGEGGFGITYIGCDLRLELKVAIKEYFPTDKVTRHAMASLTVSSYIGAAASGYEAGKERFLSEARAMARMDKQPQIVSVRDFFEANNTAYIVMEYVEGTTFKELVSQKGGKIPPAELLPMMEPLFFALSAMHERGLIHRDISPDNLMLENGALRLLDFGCARESSRGTETMTIALKHGYAPIEQYQHKGQGPWTDVYGLSATIYYCLTGKTPPQALDRLCEDELMLPRKLGVPLSERQEKALLYGMGIRPRRRFQSVEELHTALYEEQVPIPQPPETEPEQGLLEEPVREFIKVTPPQVEVKPGDKTVIEPLFEPATMPEPAPQPEHRSTWQPEPQPVAAEQPAAVAVMEAEPAQKESLPTRLTKNKKNLAIGGIAAAVVIVVVILLAVFLPGSTGPTVDPGPGGDPTPPVASPSPAVTDEPGGHTVTLTGTSSELGQQFLDAMADDSVASIIVPANMGSFGVPGESVAITKPVLVQEGTELDFMGREVSVTGNGSLLIEGMLAVNQAFIFSGGGRLEVAETGILAGDGLLWFHSEENFIFRGQALEMAENQFVFGDPEAIFADAAVVTTRAELLQKNSWGQPIIIASGANIQLVSEFGQRVPILIEEGAVVHSGENAAWVIDNALLINRGTLDGWVWTNNAKIINEGTLAPTEAFFLQEGSTLFNQPSGEAVLHSIPWFSQGTYTLNLGTITGHVELMGGMMLNQGAIVNKATDFLGFDIHTGGEFVNRNYGTVDIYENFWNDGHVFNGGGTITIHDGAGFDNCSFFENEGSLHLEQAGYVGNSGIVRWIAGIGHVDQPERLDHLIYDNSSYDWNNGMDIVEISTADELIAWAKREDSAATLTQDITVEGELHITASMEIPEGVTLTVDRLTISGTTVRVGGTLEAHEVRVLDSALLHANGKISVRDGGLLELDGSHLIYEGNDFDLSGSTLRLANGSDLYLAWAEHAAVSYVEILSDAHLLSLNGGVLEGAEVMIQDGQLLFPYGMRCYETDLTIEGIGGLRTTGMELETGSMTISGRLITAYGDVRLGGGVTMVNHGLADFSSYDGSHLVLVDGVIENHGTLSVAGLSMEVNGRLNNHGTLYYGWGGSITGNVTGNPAEKHPDSD